MIQKTEDKQITNAVNLLYDKLLGYLVPKSLLLEFAMIRLITPDDTDALTALANATGLFGPKELKELGEVLSDYFSGNIDRDHF
nr:hypothetical protein [Nostoc sp. EkiNYC01]